ncbi:hypothetical protein SynMITS9220_01988 [Synechococcus sp. MIT S9220]|nr:hypothetical protein SynMITS9220_01988 [Synechococcus sp. MIT S9220]
MKLFISNLCDNRINIVAQDEKKQICLVFWRDRDLKENLQWFSWKI